MSKFDYSQLDGNLLRLLVAVVETGSVTGAAQRLGVTQSAVSHLLQKLREITQDPLFVKSGRGIVATARAEVLVVQARELLSAMERFVRHGDFSPARWQANITIAANDLQRDLLLPKLMERLRVEAPHVTLSIIPSHVPSLAMLRNEDCQLALSPRPPDGTDIMQKRLFEESYRIFYDPTIRSAPTSRAEYLMADHITVLHAPNRRLDLDQWFIDQGIQRRFAVTVPVFAGLASFISGSPLIATAPGRLRNHLLRDLADSKVPMTCPKMPMYLLWHLRYQHDVAHQWLRGLIQGIAREIV